MGVKKMLHLVNNLFSPSLIHLIISYSAETMLLFMPRGGLDAVIVGTPANSALGLVN